MYSDHIPENLRGAKWIQLLIKYNFPGDSQYSHIETGRIKQSHGCVLDSVLPCCLRRHAFNKLPCCRRTSPSLLLICLKSSFASFLHLGPSLFLYLVMPTWTYTEWARPLFWAFDCQPLKHVLGFVIFPSPLLVPFLLSAYDVVNITCGYCKCLTSIKAINVWKPEKTNIQTISHQQNICNHET